ncbi:MAG: hypothetical protein E6H06_13780 [Bacteroidetes bacterium]|nr:MAG: hypothetical protein E6H06_13780 [Bacteroidota bacterium]
MPLKLIVISSVLAFVLSACSNKNSARAKNSFCDTVCMSDSLKFIEANNPLKPYVYISAKNCTGDTLTWGYEGQNKNILFNYKLNKDYTRCLIKDTAFALLVFNTCDNGRGYFMKFSFGKKASFRKSTSAINNFDPKFSVADSLLAYTDKGNIFVEDILTGKKATLTFGSSLDFDFDAIHETLDSVNITRNRIWAKVKIDGDWRALEKSITLQ